MKIINFLQCVSTGLVITSLGICGEFKLPGSGTGKNYSLNYAHLSNVKNDNSQDRVFIIEKRYLLFPVKSGPENVSNKRVKVIVGKDIVRDFDIGLTEKPDWFAHVDVSDWRGRRATVDIENLDKDSKIWDLVRQSDEIWAEDRLYKEKERGQLRFSPKRGWNNDPNGLVFANGEYHLFFQHNPYGWGWGNMHWGHAISMDLVHWKELPIAIYPTKYGDWAFSGSAVVDKDNTSGWKKGDKELIVAAYTSTGRGECIVYSNNGGRSFEEYGNNPVVKHRGRDPRLLWYKPGRHWVMAVYDELENKQWIAFYTSPNLKDWTYQSRIEGFYECPDLFELNGKWVLTAANSDYMIGEFDGKKFIPQTPKLKGHRGFGFYAAQTYSNDPKGRIVQIGWLQTETRGMPFNQSMSLPIELKLCKTISGYRLSWKPVDELTVLRDGHNQAKALDQFRSELIELRAEFEAVNVTFRVRGVQISYDPVMQELIINNHRAAAPLVNGKQRLCVYVDRTAFEIFASDGLTYIPYPFISDPNNQSVVVDGKVKSLEVYKLKSIWE